MTRCSDNLESGDYGFTGATDTVGQVELTKTFRATGATSFSTLLPAGTRNITSTLFIISNDTAATTGTCIVSAGTSTLITYSAFGSSQGVLTQQTVAGLGTVAIRASACANLSATSDTLVTVSMSAANAELQLCLNYTRDRVAP